MNIQRFLAPTSREALAKARAAFGDATLILSNRQVAEGVEVVAATEASLARLDEEAQSRTTARVAAAQARPAAQPEVDAPADVPGIDAGVQADTEQLAMSTLSFQDYVRERMLRRQHEAAQPVASAVALQAEPASPPVVLATPAPAPAPMPAAAAPARTPHPSSSSQDRWQLPDPDEVPTETMPLELSPAAPDVLSEMRAMRRLMDERFSALAWLGQARQDPIQSNFMLKLVRAGYSPGLARSVLETMPQGLEPVEAVRRLLADLEGRLGGSSPVTSIPEEGGAFALIGATGVGKTTSAAKLAGLGARLHGPGAVGLITLDTQRAGAPEQLRALGRSLGVVAHLAPDRAALQDLLQLLAKKKLVIIDTPGVAPHDPKRPELLGLLDLPGIKRVLVLNAGAHGDTLEDAAIAFKLGETRQAIVSKVDEAAKLGPVLDVLMRHQFAVRGVSNGQRVAEDWRAGDARSLVRASMQATRRSAFDPRSADLPCYFTADECAAA
ncbi:flagellar biosynthesis protein FlhF [Variovorax sp. J22P168]|uniref:flagellar biosynthesis protein FlhF n=1 Tax=Variovorax jilinensis TaxID=3053513 RepID=UPI0025776196|nr:flagellar biosynthesis protein FlhF [Variovorax sp. J22P168]MDM0014754.1 flagellar biosynthesis protein FlhF [Variovorax sp. J22P168]